MTGNRYAKALLLALSGALVALAALGAATALACTPKNNVDTVLDDSGSMVSSDANQIRQEAINLLIDKHSEDSDYTLSAGEFGTKANAVFSPALVKDQSSQMKDALEKYTHADNGGTDYNLAFSQAKELNPNSQLRIFLSDGRHNQGTYNNGHQGGPETDVIGFSSSSSSSLLQQIAEDTGGTYYENVTSSNLQAVVNEIDDQSQCAASQSSTSGSTSSSSGSDGSTSVTYNVNVNVNNTVNVSNNTVVVVVSWRSPRIRLAIDRANKPRCTLTSRARKLPTVGPRGRGPRPRGRGSDRRGHSPRQVRKDCIPQGSSAVAPFRQLRGRTYAIAKFRDVGTDRLSFNVRTLRRLKNARYTIQAATYNS